MPKSIDRQSALPSPSPVCRQSLPCKRVTAFVPDTLDSLLGRPASISYPLALTTAGREKSKRKRQNNDCTVRALAVAFALPYDEAYDILALAGRECAEGFPIYDWMQGKPWAKEVKGFKGHSLAYTINRLTDGLYFVGIRGHILAVENGKAFDSWEPNPLAPVTEVWRLDPSCFNGSAQAVDEILSRIL